MTARAVRFSALSPGSYALPTGREPFGEGGPRWDVAGILCRGSRGQTYNYKSPVHRLCSLFLGLLHSIFGSWAQIGGDVPTNSPKRLVCRYLKQYRGPASYHSEPMSPIFFRSMMAFSAIVTGLVTNC